MSIAPEREPDVFDCLDLLLDLTDVERERWVDHRIIGMALDQIAARDGCSHQAVWTTVLQRSDAKLAQLSRRGAA